MEMNKIVQEERALSCLLLHLKHLGPSFWRDAVISVQTSLKFWEGDGKICSAL